MVPAQAPLPTDSRLPFQLAAGSQTSILISESATGWSVAEIRQKAGRDLYWSTPLPPGLNAPAATVWAAVIVAFLRERAVSQSAPHSGAVANTRMSGFILARTPGPGSGRE